MSIACRIFGSWVGRGLEETTVMNAQVETLASRPGATRWLFPVLSCAVLLLATAALRRRIKRPHVAPVSDAWLKDHEYTAGQHAEA